MQGARRGVMTMIDKIELDRCYNCDCAELMQAMKAQGIKADWCITDPPYGISADEGLAKKSGTQFGKAKAKSRTYKKTDWDKVRIGGGYFDLMREVSDHQVIFGGNYYTDYLPPTKSWLVWNKRNYKSTDRNDYGDCELAWCSDGVARVINYLYNGMLQADMKNKDERFHPTQKPVGMWIQVLNLYTKKGDVILDAFAGSQSLRIACHRMGRHYIGAEREKEYYDKGNAWYLKETSQLSIFDLLDNLE